MSGPDIKDILLGLSHTLSGWFEELIKKTARSNKDIAHRLDTIIAQNNRIIDILSKK